ncbi:phosphonoacetaldehyde reductase [Helicobacter trogontum]|uniref:Iron-containing alcohol dehydrogenase n=1 Tax=Helicobacter trogontum TaxID=50960 RepID=A0A4U8SDG1_9HELI|nr:phosphonoacetaldehyde reductase [Helicobacter trogontum]TLD84180.1 iron-containing alcohol dehydrogenase [Helicobacter trogontum]
MSFNYYNPVQICFDIDILESLQTLAQNSQNKRYLLVTSKGFGKGCSNRDISIITETLPTACLTTSHAAFQYDYSSKNHLTKPQSQNFNHATSNNSDTKRTNLVQSIANIFNNIIVLDCITPNPELDFLQSIKAKLKGQYDAIIALGGGSVIDSAKFFALKNEIAIHHETLEILGEAQALPLFACPSTAGTGSELTQWTTIWNSKTNIKYSLSHKCLYPQIAFYDISLLLSLPLALTLHTTLDSLSHAIESIWNKNANPISTQYAKAAIELILENLIPLYDMLNKKNLPSRNSEYNKQSLKTLRRNLALACMQAALSFSNTQTALAHAISYPITMQCGVPHGLACSFSLPILLDCINDERADLILNPYKQKIKNLFTKLQISSNPRIYGLDSDMINNIFNSLNARAKNGLLDIAKVKTEMLRLLSS